MPVIRGIRESGYRPHPGTVWIESNWSSLPTGKWVAADGTGWYVAGNTMDHLLSQLTINHRTEDDVAITFIPAHSR